MHPELFEIGPITIYWYGAMIALALLSAVANCTYLGWREGRTPAFMSDLVFWMAVGGLVGARLAYVAANFDEYSQQPITVLYLHEGGLIYYGGVIGGVIGIALFGLAKGESVMGLLDIVAVAAPLGHALGRIGCFLNGCCYGKDYGGILAVSFPADSHVALAQGRLGPGLPVHPVQLYEAGLNILLYLGLLWFFLRKKGKGKVAVVYLMAYAVIRFLVERFRGDERLMVMGLTAAQAASIVLFVIGVGTWMWVCGHENGKIRSCT